MDYATEVLLKLKEKNLDNFTHSDILAWTFTNCPYTVVQSIKLKLEKDGKRLGEKWEDNKVRRGNHKRYFIEELTA